MRWSGVFASLALVAFAAALWPKQTDESVRPARSHSAESGLEWPERTSFQAAWRAGRLEPRKPDQRLPYFSGRALVPVADESAKDLVRIPKLVLIDQHGRARNEKLFKGRPTVLAFFSTTCTGSCPNALDALKRLEESLRDPREMQFVGVTADPLHDSPDTLRHYARGMELRTAFRWTLLTGAADTVLKLKTQTLGDGEVNSQNVFLFDQRGRLRARLNVSSPDFFIELAGALEKLAIPVQRVAARAKRPERI